MHAILLTDQLAYTVLTYDFMYMLLIIYFSLLFLDFWASEEKLISNPESKTCS